jgi:hypothetical protein
MSRKVLVLTAIVCTFCACTLQAAQINSTWVGGEWGVWENASNWDPPTVPENGVNTYAVSITDAAVELSSDHSIDSLDTYNTVKLEGSGTFEQPDITLTNNLTNHGYLKMAGPEIFGKVVNLAGATIFVYEYHGFYVWGPGGIQNFGTILFGSAQMWAEYDINNFGLINMYDGICDAEGNIINNATGIIRGSGIVGPETTLINNLGIIHSGGGTLSLFASSINNNGTIKNNPGSTIMARAFSPTDYNNQGVMEINSDGAITFDSNFTNEPNGIVKMLVGTLAAPNITQKADANFAGFGGIAGNVQIDPDAIIKLTGPTNIIGDVNIPAGATLEISDGQTLITGHTVCDGTIHLIGGTVVFQGGCDCDGCNIINEAGTDRNHFDINADGIEDFKDFASFANSWLWQADWYTP